MQPTRPAAKVERHFLTVGDRVGGGRLTPRALATYSGYQISLGIYEMTGREASGQSMDSTKVRPEGNVPVEKILGKRTFWTMVAPDCGKSYIVRRNRQRRLRGLEGYIVLAEGPELDVEQILFVQKMVFDPKSYYHGIPKFRRFPHDPNFALHLTRENTTLDLMIDLHNPGWDFWCSDEHYSSWHWADFRSFAKSLFPEFASPSSRAVWKKGTIKRLIMANGG